MWEILSASLGIKNIYNAYFVCVCFYAFIFGQELKGKRKEKQDRERSTSQDSNSGCPEHKGATCRRAAHEAVNANQLKHLKAGVTTLSPGGPVSCRI